MTMVNNEMREKDVQKERKKYGEKRERGDKRRTFG
jgi:hypothetical protein